MLLLLVHIVQEAMARHVPVLVLLNAQYKPPVTIMSVENKNIKYAYNMMKMNIEDHIIVLSFLLQGFGSLPMKLASLELAASEEMSKT